VADAAIAILLPTLKRFSCNGAMDPELSSKFTLSDQKNCQRFCETLSQQKHVVLQSMAPLQLKTL
jgi:hypothetical protein